MCPPSNTAPFVTLYGGRAFFLSLVTLGCPCPCRRRRTRTRSTAGGRRRLRRRAAGDGSSHRPPWSREAPRAARRATPLPAGTADRHGASGRTRTSRIRTCRSSSSSPRRLPTGVASRWLSGPQVALLRRGSDLCLVNNVDFILAFKSSTLIYGM